MAVKKGKTRIIFTCSESQANWMKDVANSRNISIAKLIRFSLFRLKRYADDHFALNDDDLELLCKIAKTPWLFDDDDD